VAWSLQLGCKLPKELGIQSRLIGLEVCLDSNELDFGSGPTTNRRAVTACHPTRPTVMWDTGMQDWRNGWKEPFHKSRWRGTRRSSWLFEKMPERRIAHKMTRWAAENGVAVSDDEDGEYDDMGICFNYNHQGMTGTYCPGCEDTGFVHESVVCGKRECRQQHAICRSNCW
jgi:hypothetical protein